MKSYSYLGNFEFELMGVTSEKMKELSKVNAVGIPVACDGIEFYPKPSEDVVTLIFK